VFSLKARDKELKFQLFLMVVSLVSKLVRKAINIEHCFHLH